MWLGKSIAGDTPRMCTYAPDCASLETPCLFVPTASTFPTPSADRGLRVGPQEEVGVHTGPLWVNTVDRQRVSWKLSGPHRRDGPAAQLSALPGVTGRFPGKTNPEGRIPADPLGDVNRRDVGSVPLPSE